MTVSEVIEHLQSIPTYGFSDEMKEAIRRAIFMLEMYSESEYVQ